jgi:hypothetical protein
MKGRFCALLSFLSGRFDMNPTPNAPLAAAHEAAGTIERGSGASAWSLRSKAAGIHLLGSACVVALAAGLVFLLWYPWPYTAMAGGGGLFLLITGVDIVLGPLITFAIFDPRRKPWTELRRDLIIVVLLQLAALGYGLYVMHTVRPVALALENARFRVVTAQDVLLDELPKAQPAFQQLSHTGPATVNTSLPATAEEQFDSVTQALAGHDIGTRPTFWRAWDDNARARAKTIAKPVESLRKHYAKRTAELDAALQRTGRTEAQLRYIPVLARYGDWVAFIDANSGDIVGFAPFDGFI